MSKKLHNDNDEMRAEYVLEELRGGVHGKYAERYQSGTNVVLLDPDVAIAFPTAKAVNDALRMLINIADASKHAGH